MLDVWRAADEMDMFHSAWNFDHFYPINVPDTTGPCMEAWVTLSALAQATKRIRIGCMVTGAVYRHPAVLASMISTLDIVSDGRLEVGIGAGWSDEECAAYGIDLGSLKKRFDRFDEVCEVLVSLLTQETTDFQGKFFNLTQARNNPKPIQKPHPPICIGGNGEKRTLPNVAKWAQHWNYAAFDLDGFIAKRDVLRAQCESQGKNVDEIMTSIHHAPDFDNLGPTEKACAEFKEAGLGLMIFYLPPPHSAAQLEPLARIAEKIG
jgi:F420-dependent oxidoreductase-like protein